MPKMKDSGIEWIGEIPENWELIKIAGLYSLRNTKVSDNDYPPLSVTMKGIVPQLETAAKTNDHDNRKLVKKGDFAINSRSDRRGSCGVSEYDGSVSLINTVMKPNRSMNSQYYNWLFHTSLFADEFYKWGHGIVDDLWTTTWQDMKKITVPFPSIEEQRIIADFLDKKCVEIDSLQKDIEKEIETLEEYKKTMVFEYVTHGINHADFTDTDSDVWETIPADWKLVDIKYLFEIVKRIAGKEGYDILAITQKGIRVKDLSNNEGQLAANYSGYQFVYPGEYAMNHMDLLTGWVDLSDKFGVTSPDYRVFRLRDEKCYDKSFYKYVMQCCYMNRIFYSLGQGVSNLGRWRLQTSAFNDFKVPVPPYEEQIEIGKFLDDIISQIDDLISKKKAQLETLAEYKKSLIYEYVTGKKEVPSEEAPANEELNKNAVILGIIADKLGEQQTGRIQLQKVHFMMTMCVMMSQKAQYYRYNHGPYDVCLNDYIDVLLKNKWYQEKKGGAYILVKGEKHSEFLNTYKELIEKLEPEVDKLLNMLKSMNVLKTSRIERIATLYAAWNDLLLDGVSPTDDQIIRDVMNNWTENKGNTQYATWQGSLNKMKQNGLIPKGTGKHTLPKQQ